MMASRLAMSQRNGSVFSHADSASSLPLEAGRNHLATLCGVEATGGNQSNAHAGAAGTSIFDVTGDASFPRTVHLHLTLRFLGDVDCWRIEDLKTSLLKRVGMVGRFELRCERLECFPNLRRPKVVWAWVHDEQEQLAALQRIVVIATETFTQQPKENQFIGHVTLARLKRIRRAEVERIASFFEGAVHRQFGSWAANEVELVRSELSPQGSRYTVLAEVPLV
jgi:2'-5' RNA ligase